MPFVWDEDPGLDRDAPGFKEAWDEYQRTLDHTKLPTKEKVTIFWCKPLKVQAYSDMLEEPSQSGQAIYAVRASLDRLENFEGEDGKPVVLRDGCFQQMGSYRLLNTDELDRFFHPVLLGRLGAFIITHSSLDPTRGQGS